MKTNAMRYLDDIGVQYVIKPHSQPVFTSEDAARERGVRLSQIVKTMVVKTSRDESVIALIPGNRRLDLKQMGEVLGDKKLKLVDRAEVQKLTGYEVGAISPIGLRKNFHMLLDKHILDEQFVDISSGRPDAGIELLSQELLRITGAETAVISTSQ